MPFESGSKPRRTLRSPLEVVSNPISGRRGPLEVVPSRFPGCPAPWKPFHADFPAAPRLTQDLWRCRLPPHGCSQLPQTYSFPDIQPLSQQIGQLRIIEVLHQEMGIAMNT